MAKLSTAGGHHDRTHHTNESQEYERSNQHYIPRSNAAMKRDLCALTARLHLASSLILLIFPIIAISPYPHASTRSNARMQNRGLVIRAAIKHKNLQQSWGYIRHLKPKKQPTRGRFQKHPIKPIPGTNPAGRYAYPEINPKPHCLLPLQEAARNNKASIPGVCEGKV